MADRMIVTQGTPEATQTVASTNTSQTLEAALGRTLKQGDSSDPAARNAVAAYISCETNDIRYAFSTAATQAGVGHLIAVGEAILISAPEVRAFRFISAVADTHGALKVTLYF